MKKNRILSILLSLVMMVTFMPALAFASDNDAASDSIQLYYRSGDTTDHKSSEGAVSMFTHASTDRPLKMGVSNKSVVWYELNTSSTAKKVTWSTNKADVVAFDTNGKATTTSQGAVGTDYLQGRCVKLYAIGAGAATITVVYTNENGTFSDSVNVNVRDAIDPTGIGTLEDISIRVGETKQLVPPAITPENAEYKSATWTVTPNNLVSNNQKSFVGNTVGEGTYKYTITKYDGTTLVREANITVSEAEKKIRIGDQGYDTLEAAFEAVKPGETIQVDEQVIDVSSPIPVAANGTIRVMGGKQLADESGSSTYIETPTINGEAFAVRGSSTKLVFTNVKFNNASGNVMTVSDDGGVTLNDDIVNGNVHLNGGSISLGRVKEFNGNVTADGSEEVEIVRTDFGDVTYKKGTNRAFLDVNNPINGTVFGEVPADKQILKVTFKVKNGTWNDGTTKDQYVTLVGGVNDELKLGASQIPAVGEKPAEGYVVGAWDKEPSTETALTRDMTYTYTYADELVVAKETAKAELDATDLSKYSGNEKTAVEKAIADAKSLIDKANTVEEVNTVKAAALGAIEKIKTDVQKAADKKAAEEKAAAEKAAALNKASNINKATVTATDIKKASKLGATTVTLGKKVKKIKKNAFKGTKIKTVVVKTKKLKKASVKNAFKGSKVTKVKVKVGSKKLNKTYVKKYKKIFTKKNVGKKVKVVA